MVIKSYSLRMRLLREGIHISGAEKIISDATLQTGLMALFKRSMDHSLGTPDEIHFKIEEIKDDILFAESLPVSTILAEGVENSRKNAVQLLKLIGISERVIMKTVDDISMGPSPDRNNMRGAMIIDIETGERLEPDPYRGIRVSRMDFGEGAEEAVEIEMKRIGAEGSRVKDALALATKVAMAGTLAELCWSDNPDYTTGYIASKRFGYVRFLTMKKEGDRRGGRAFFVSGSKIDMKGYIDYLKKRPVLITEITPGFKPCKWEEFLKRAGTTRF